MYSIITIWTLFSICPIFCRLCGQNWSVGAWVIAPVYLDCVFACQTVCIGWIFMKLCITVGQAMKSWINQWMHNFGVIWKDDGCNLSLCVDCGWQWSCPVFIFRWRPVSRAPTTSMLHFFRYVSAQCAHCVIYKQPIKLRYWLFTACIEVWSKQWRMIVCMRWKTKIKNKSENYWNIKAIVPAVFTVIVILGKMASSSPVLLARKLLLNLWILITATNHTMPVIFSSRVTGLSAGKC